MATDAPIDPQAPIVMAGVGGSGTRVLCRIVSGMGVYVGDARNGSEDNLWWLTLFKRPEWFYGLDGPEDPSYRYCSELFRSAMMSGALPTPRAAWTALRGWRESSLNWLRDALSMFWSDGVDPDRHVAWGWKEPNAMMQLPWIHHHFPRMRYVHLVRHGLDMAFTGRDRPMFDFWDRHYDVGDGPLADARLKFWLAANEDVLGYCRDALGDDHLVVRFEELCHEPRKQVERIAGFLDGSVEGDLLDRLGDHGLEELASIPRPPGSIGRYKDHDLSVFDPADLDRLAELGYEVEGA